MNTRIILYAHMGNLEFLNNSSFMESSAFFLSDVSFIFNIISLICRDSSKLFWNNLLDKA